MTAQAEPKTEKYLKQIQIQKVPQEGDDWNGLPPDKDISRPVKIEPVFDTAKSQFLVELTKKEWEFVKHKMGESHDLSLSHDISSDVPHPLWQGRMGTVILEPNTMFLDMDNALDVLKLGVMRGHWMVANSLEEYQRGDWPEARWVIIDNNQDIKEKATNVRKRSQALAELADMTDDMVCEVLTVALNKSHKSMPVGNRLVEFEKVAMANPDKVMEVIKMDKDERELIALVHYGIDKNILRQKGPTVYYGDYPLGVGAEGAVEYLQAGENEQLRAQIMAKILEW